MREAVEVLKRLAKIAALQNAGSALAKQGEAIRARDALGANPTPSVRNAHGSHEIRREERQRDFVDKAWLPLR